MSGIISAIDVTIAAMHKNPIAATLLTLAIIALVTVIIYNLPPIHERFAWRVELVTTYLRMSLNPVGAMPTPIPQEADPATPTPKPSPTQGNTSTPIETKAGPTSTATASPTPIPDAYQLPVPQYEKQGPNECGPTTLAIYLHYYGWTGTKDDITRVVKPTIDDRNVNVDELVYFVGTHAGWLNAKFRVGGDLALLKNLIAGGFPVMIEESFYDDQSYWPGDDLWAAHYLLLTGYNDSTQAFTGQDSFRGPNKVVPYKTLDQYWHVFNRVYILVYKPDQEEALKSILGPQWNPDANRQHALDVARAETQANPKDAFAWFNLGSNLVYFEQYAEAGHAYDSARQIGLPQRMLRYQFGPFIAYFHAARYDDLLAVTEYILKNTPNSEEAHLWHGWGLYRKGNTAGAIADFQTAVKDHPGYQDALYALNFLGASPLPVPTSTP
jgi:hypothetical protein